MVKTKKSFLNKVILAVVVGLLVVVGVYAYKNRYKEKPQTGSQYGPTMEQQKQEADINAQAKKQAIENGNGSSQGTETPATPNSSANITLSAQKESNNTVTIFTKLAKISNGTCELAVTNGTKQTSQTAEVIYQSEYSSCAGFSVPVESIGLGIWTIKLTVTYGGQSISNSITYEVK